MTNNSILINSYLQNEMSTDEKAAFENRLKTDKELQDELQIQKQVINAAINAGLRGEFTKAIRHRVIIRRVISWAAIITLIVSTTLIWQFRQNIFSSHTSFENIEMADLKQNTNPFINPPLPAADVPGSEYSFDAEKGDTIFYPSGSIICFPPSALVDGSGNIIKGSVKVTYREFADPLDFFLSGIPMQYDSAGKKYNFESSGMCEINASQDNKPVFVNQQAKPAIYLSGENKDPRHNLYFLDTVAHSWKFTGKDIITEVKRLVRSKGFSPTQLTAENSSLTVKPVMPRKASIDNQHFSIEIEPGSFEELFAYDNLKFEVVDESTYRRSDADEQWENVKLDHTDADGIYNLTFTNSRRKVTYKVRPVLEGADYDAALKVFNEKNKVYEQALKNRQLNDKKLSDSITDINRQLTKQWNEDKEWNDKMNALIIERNKKLKALKKMQMDALERSRIADSIRDRKQLDQMLILNRAQWKLANDQYLSSEVIRSFSINNFGVWNCDHPEYPNNEVPLIASYTDSLSRVISFSNIAVVYKGFNGITPFSGQGQIRVMPGQDNMLWAIKDSSFYYFTYKDFAEAKIERGVTSFTFKMRKTVKMVSSYNEIRELVEKL